VKVSVRIEGEKEVLRSLSELGKAGQDAAKRAFGRVTARVVQKAKPLTPVEPEDGGQLRDSVRAAKPTRTRSGLISAAVVAGGAPLKRVMEGRKANVYAVIQHEDLTLKHTTGQGKFLEIPFLREAPSAHQELERELDVEAKRATG